jgi:CubicO group peptidase (beta-lactamase class C family)
MKIAILIIIFIGLLVTNIINSPTTIKAYKFLTLFDEDKIANNFRSPTEWHVDHRFANFSDHYKYDRLEKFIPLPKSFVYKNETIEMQKWLQDYWTTGLMVLKVNNVTDAKVIYEEYYLGNDQNSHVISWSVGKSIVSALIGIAIDQQKIKSVKQTVKEYLPEFEETAYGNVTIENLLKMSSGIDFDENYFNFFSDINRMGVHMTLNHSMGSFLKTFHAKCEQGTKFDYISSDTQMLGLVLMRATNSSLIEYLSNLKDLYGTSNETGWLRSGGEELAFGTVIAKLEFYASFGHLYLNEGYSPLNGKNLISKSWICNSTKQYWNDTIGYGYQWWVPRENEYMAIGVYNQFVYVSSEHNIVIAKSSANAKYESDPIKSELIAIAAFREIARHYGTL